MNTFKRVIMVADQPEIAKVNRKTGVLYLSSKVWDGLPASEKDFVLYHEAGHLKLETANEFEANKYAVGQFLKAGTFSNKELGAKIMVMRSILDKADGQTENFTGEVIGEAVGGVTSVLKVFGIGTGTRARQKEAAAQAAAAATIYDAQAKATATQSKASAAKSKSTMTIILVSSVLVIVGIAIYFTLRRK